MFGDQFLKNPTGQTKETFEAAKKPVSERLKSQLHQGPLVDKLIEVSEKFTPAELRETI